MLQAIVEKGIHISPDFQSCKQSSDEENQGERTTDFSIDT
jgi:hypothetical protein